MFLFHFPQFAHCAETKKSYEAALSGSCGKKKPITVPMTSCLYRPGSTGRSVAEESASKFLTVVNGGTELFERLELQSLVSSLDLVGLANKHFKAANGNVKRGNSLVTFGSCGSKNLQFMDDFGSQFYGCTTPYISNDDGDGLVKSFLEIGTEIGKRVGVPECMDGFLDANPQLKEMFDELITPVLGSNTRFTVAYLVLQQIWPHADLTKEHVDGENCNLMPSSLCVSLIVKLVDAKEMEHLFRVGMIFTNRHSWFTSYERFKACKVLATYCEAGLKALPPACNDFAPFSEYFNDAVGNKGVTVMLDGASGKIIGCCFKTHAHVNKQGHYLTAVVHALYRICEVHTVSFETFIALCYPITQLPGIFSYTIALHELTDEKAWKNLSTFDGGVVGYLFWRIRLLNGGRIGGGVNVRMQVNNHGDMAYSDISKAITCQYAVAKGFLNWFDDESLKCEKSKKETMCVHAILVWSSQSM